MTVRTNRAIGQVATGPIGLSSDRLPAFQEIHYEIDMANVALDVTAGTFVSADQYVVMSLPKHTCLQSLQAICHTALVLGSGARIDIGDKTANSATYYVSNATTLTAGTVLTQAITANPMYFYGAADDQLLLKITGTGIATGILRLVIVVADFTRNQAAQVSAF